jgi:hypothetical protein
MVRTPDGGLWKLADNGHLLCNVCDADKLWCQHQEDMIKDLTSDQLIIWQKPENAEYPGLVYLMVPIFPSSNMWTRVDLRLHVTPTFVSYKVWWGDCPTAPVDDTFGVPEYVYLTTLTPGEGRVILRQLMLEYMWCDKDRRKECVSSSHGYHEETLWREHHKGGHSLFYAEDWSVYTTGMCIYCNMKTDNALSDPTMLPETQGGWNNK